MGTRISPLWFLACVALFSFGTPRLGAFAGLGAALTQFGVPSVLADPVLDLRDANGNSLMANDNWIGHPTIADSDQRLCAAK